MLYASRVNVNKLKRKKEIVKAVRFVAEIGKCSNTC